MFIGDLLYCGIFAEGKSCEASRDSRCLENGSVNNSVARQQIRNTHQWSNWEAVFSTRSVVQLRDATIEQLGEVFSMQSVPRLYNEEQLLRLRSLDPCGGGVEYLHRDPASRRRRRKGKSQNWDSKIWSRDPRDSDPRKTTLARTSSIYKWQTRPLVREGAPQKEDRNCQTIINIWSWAPDGARHEDLLIDRPSVAM
jgi:hypothetical protein